MNRDSKTELVLQLPVRSLTATVAPPAIVSAAGVGADFAWGEFFEGQIRNRHTRRNYLHAVRTFLAWAERHGLALHEITPAALGRYLDDHRGSPPTKKLHLAGVRAFFDQLVLRHVVILNPANSVRGPRYQTIEGKTPEIPKSHIRRLLESIDTNTVVGLRDKAIISLLVYTAVQRVDQQENRETSLLLRHVQGTLTQVTGNPVLGKLLERVLGIISHSLRHRLGDHANEAVAPLIALGDKPLDNPADFGEALMHVMGVIELSLRSSRETFARRPSIP